MSNRRLGTLPKEATTVAKLIYGYIADKKGDFDWAQTKKCIPSSTNWSASSSPRRFSK
jgi:hypothetical protein